jgi:hypothetical protein
VRRVPGAERAYIVRANIGAPRAGALGGPFREPDWGTREVLDLRLTLDGDAEITPAWHDVQLPKRGDTPDVEFRVQAYRDGPLAMRLRVYTAREFVLLEDYELTIEVAPRLKVA